MVDLQRAERRQAVDTQALYQRIETRLHRMHLSARKASLLAGLPPDGIRTIARGRIPRADKLKRLAEILQVDLNWFGLDTGIDTAPQNDAKEPDVNKTETKEAVRVLDERYQGFWEEELMRVQELDVRTTHGGDIRAATPVIDWGLPRSFVQHLLPAGGDRLRVISQAGDAMSPTIVPGQKLMVDIDDRTPSPPGLFALWDGMAVVVRRIEYLSLTGLLRVSSDNPRYGTVETEPGNVQVLGRIVMSMQPM